MTTGFQQQDQSLNFCFMKSAREPQQVGKKLQVKPETPPAPRPPEKRSFK
jgi:hypothetical protein